MNFLNQLNNRFTNTLMFQNTIWYILNLIFTMIFIGSTILFTTSYFLINNIKQNTVSLQKDLINASKEKNIDWAAKLEDLLYPDFGNFYVKVTNSKGKIIAESPGWNQIVSSSNSEEITKDWFRDLVLNRDEMIYYTRSTNLPQPNGGIKKITIIAELNHLGNLLILLCKVLIASTLVGGFIGSIFIYFVTKKIIRPMKKLTNTMSEINDFSDFKKRVILPNGPYELTKLGIAFNTLLIKIEDQFEKERAFVSNASHELRTPITAFKGHINLLKRWGKEDPQVLNHSIQTLETESNRMQRLINQLLILASTDSPYIKKTIVNLGAIIRETANELIYSLDHELEVQIQIKPNVNVCGNIDQLKQVAIILIENAIKYTNRGGQLIISVNQESDWAIFQVCDSGIGIEPQEIPFIFERFYRVDKARSRKTGGSGLGLSIAKAIISNHKGHIDVLSEVGIGSTFTVKLPLFH